MTNKELWSKLDELLGGEETARRFRVWATSVIKKELLKRSESTPDEFFLHQATSILDDLNERTGARYRLSDATKALIRGRLAEGFQLEDFFKVHEVKCAKWLGKESYEDNLRPSTLYRPSHFSEYHAEWYAWDRKRTEKRGNRIAGTASCATKEQESEEMVIELPELSHEDLKNFVESISDNVPLMALWRRNRMESTVIRYAVKKWIEGTGMRDEGSGSQERSPALQRPALQNREGE